MIPFDLGFEVFIVPLLWAGLVITATVIAVTKRKSGGFRRAIAVLVVGGLVLATLVVTPPGHRGVIYSATGGVELEERPEGISLMVPIFQNANMISVREQKYENLEVYAQTKDLLEVTVQIAVNYFVEPSQAADIFRDVGKSYELAIIEPAVLDITKREVGRIDALDFPRERLALTNDIRSSLNQRLSVRGINVTFVAVQDSIFDSAFTEAVLAKEVADEKAEESLRLVQVAVNEAEQVRQRAQGDADAEALLGAGKAQAISAVASALGFTPEEYLTWLRTTVWDGALPQTLVTEGNTDLLLAVGPR